MPGRRHHASRARRGALAHFHAVQTAGMSERPPTRIMMAHSSSTHLAALFWRHFTAAPRASMSTQLLSLPQLGHLPLVGNFVEEPSTCRHIHTLCRGRQALTRVPKPCG